jgi:type IV secretion system protein VirB1
MKPHKQQQRRNSNSRCISKMDFLALSQQCAPNVAPQTMAAIVKTESAFRPLTIGVNGGARLERQPKSRDEAIVTAKWLLSNGYNIDLGLGQVNSANLEKTGLSVEDAFDPCKNLAASASILQENYKQARGKFDGEQATLNAAISAYNTGNFKRGFENGYVQKVVSNASNSHDQASVIAPIPLMKNKHIAVKEIAASKLKQKAVSKEAEDRSGDAWNVYGHHNTVTVF